MSVKRFVVLGMSMSILLIPQGASYSQAPPFPTMVSLTGSTVYNAKDNGSTDPESDWYVDRTDTINGSIAMDKNGLEFKPGNNAGESVRHQLKRGFQVSDGPASAAFRFQVTDVTTVGFILGFYSMDDDPFTTEPTYGAYFKKDATSSTVVMLTHDNMGGNNAATLTIESGADYDFVIEVDGSGTINQVTFWHRKCPSALWTSHVTTTNVPADTADMYFSMAAITSDGLGDTLTVKLFEYEADAGGQ